MLAGNNLARATVSEVEVEVEGEPRSKSITLVIDEVLNPHPAFDANDVGRKLAGPYTLVPDICGSDAWYVRVWPGGVPVGASVVAAFSAEGYGQSRCADYPQCFQTNCLGLLGLDVIDCKEHCARDCVPDRSNDTISSDLLLLPWTEPSLDFGPGASVSVADAVELTNTRACFERFPPPTFEESAGCSLHGHDENPREAAGSLLIAALAYAAIRPVRRQRQRITPATRAALRG